MQEKYRKHMTWWLDEFCAGGQVDHYVELFPKLDSRLAKFAVGIFIWNMSPPNIGLQRCPSDFQVSKRGCYA